MALDMIRDVHGAVSKDGRVIRLDFTTESGKTHSLGFASGNLGGLVTALYSMARIAAEEHGCSVQAEWAADAPVIDADDIQISQGRTSQELIVSLHIGPLQVGFALSKSRLKANTNGLGEQDG
jgi:hypothetical protein